MENITGGKLKPECVSRKGGKAEPDETAISDVPE
jgi:hypothetical protein